MSQFSNPIPNLLICPFLRARLSHALSLSPYPSLCRSAYLCVYVSVCTVRSTVYVCLATCLLLPTRLLCFPSQKWHPTLFYPEILPRRIDGLPGFVAFLQRIITQSMQCNMMRCDVTRCGQPVNRSVNRSVNQSVSHLVSCTCLCHCTTVPLAAQ